MLYLDQFNIMQGYEQKPYKKERYIKPLNENIGEDFDNYEEKYLKRYRIKDKIE